MSAAERFAHMLPKALQVVEVVRFGGGGEREPGRGQWREAGDRAENGREGAGWGV